MRIETSTICAAVLVAAMSFCAELRAENMVNIDDLPRKAIALPNGNQAEVITFNDHNWRVVDPSVLNSTEARDPDVCFEAKFDMFVPPDRLRLFGVQGMAILDEKLRRRAQTEFKRNDNVWLCGTLRSSPGGKKVDFNAVDLLKQPPDNVKFETRIRKLEAEGSADRLIELGHRIEQQTKQDVAGFTDFDKLTILRDKAFDLGLQLKEKSLRAEDADGHFALGVQWRDLRRRNSKFRELVRKALAIDPDHPNASRVAEDELQMVKTGRRWVSKSEFERMEEDRKVEQVRQTNAEAVAREAQVRARQQAAAERPARVLAQYNALAGADEAARAPVIAALGEAIQQTIDPGFADEAIDLLVNSGDAGVDAALQNAARNELPEVRRVVLEALAWRGQSAPQAATLLGKILSAEKDLTTYKSGLGAAKALRPRLAAGALVSALNNADRSARDEAIEALKTVTQQQHTTKEAWEGWWAQNQASFDAQ